MENGHILFKYKSTVRYKEGVKFYQKCIKCGQFKPLLDFHRENVYVPDPTNGLKKIEGYRIICKDCQKKIFQAWADKHRERLNRKVLLREKIKSGRATEDEKKEFEEMTKPMSRFEQVYKKYLKRKKTETNTKSKKRHEKKKEKISIWLK